MIIFGACPRCGGAVIEDTSPMEDSPLCITCGWRRTELSREIRAEVEAHLGEKSIGNRYVHRRIGKGKTPLSGWERVKRLRELEKQRQQLLRSTG